MTTQRASDLSPAQMFFIAFIDQVKRAPRVSLPAPLPVSPHLSNQAPSQRVSPQRAELALTQDARDPKRSAVPVTPAPHTMESRLSEEIAQRIELLFCEALRWCDLNTTPNSWKRKRIYALLSPMYLEVMMEVRSFAGMSVLTGLTEVPAHVDAQSDSELNATPHSSAYSSIKTAPNTALPAELLLARARWTYEPLERDPVYLSLTPELQRALRVAVQGIIELSREVTIEL